MGTDREMDTGMARHQVIDGSTESVPVQSRNQYRFMNVRADGYVQRLEARRRNGSSIWKKFNVALRHSAAVRELPRASRGTGRLQAHASEM